AICLAAAVALHAAGARWAPGPGLDPPRLLSGGSHADARRPAVGDARTAAAALRAGVGYGGLAADLYWIRTLQHFGQERLSPPDHVRSYALLYPLLDLTTTLDPYFSIP